MKTSSEELQSMESENANENEHDHIEAESPREDMVPLFGYELLREVLIPDLLGKETPDILYWAGKHLARKFPLLSDEEIQSFFLEAGWGHLRAVKQGKNSTEYELTSPAIQKRLEMKEQSCFRLEAGFLAQQIQNQQKAITEAHEEVQRRQKKVHILVQWDQKDKIID
ncbi:YslB family protein [Falsibacillus pallidus]|uniref:YslB family protein n=1 Tax=Falsibacillus pallidus TaxID=493781 RepID=UPI003D994B11